MIPPHLTRRLLTLLGAILLVLLLILLLQVSDLLLSVWEKLQHLPDWFIWSYGVVVLLIVAGGGFLLRRMMKPPVQPPRQSAPCVPVTEEEITNRLERNAALGVEVEAARQELAEMRARQQGGEFHVAIAGDISSGKSTLIRALLPEATPETGPVGGITRQITRYLWITPAGDRIILSDLPGLNEVGTPLQTLAREEAIRAHVVLFLCEGDLTRPQLQELTILSQLSKPLVVAINKIDRLTKEELTMVEERVKERLATLTTPLVRQVTLVAGGQKERLRLTPDGKEVREVVAQPPQLRSLIKAMQSLIDQDPALLESLRDSAVFSWVAHKLDESLLRHRREKGEEVVGNYSRQAVMAAMAAVAPGLDVLLQGYLGLRMIRELCQIFEIPFHELQVTDLLKETDQRALRSLPMLLAIGGNLLKAFPGAGTVAGGALHAVAYGLIFDTLGRAIIKTLASRGDLSPHPALHYFEEGLSEDLEARMGRLLRVLLEAGAERLMTGKGKG